MTGSDFTGALVAMEAFEWTFDAKGDINHWVSFRAR